MGGKLLQRALREVLVLVQQGAGPERIRHDVESTMNVLERAAAAAEAERRAKQELVESLRIGLDAMARWIHGLPTGKGEEAALKRALDALETNVKALVELLQTAARA